MLISPVTGVEHAESPASAFKNSVRNININAEKLKILRKKETHGFLGGGALSVHSGSRRWMFPGRQRNFFLGWWKSTSLSVLSWKILTHCYDCKTCFGGLNIQVPTFPPKCWKIGAAQLSGQLNEWSTQTNKQTLRCVPHLKFWNSGDS